MVQKFYKILLLCLLFTLFSSASLWAFEKLIEGQKDIVGKAISIAKDGNIVVSGYTTSPTFGMKDIYIAKFTLSGKEVWNRHYGGFFDDWAEDLYTDKNGLYILGTTYSFGTGCSDVSIVEYMYTGKKSKMTPYGDTDCEMAKAFVKTEKGFIILAKKKGRASSYLLMIDEKGNVKNRIDVPHLEYPEGIIYKRGVGFLVFGGTHDFDHDFKIGGYLLFFDPDGNKLWEKVLGDETEYFLKDATWTEYGIVIGGFSGLSLYNFWSPLIVKVDLTGDVKYEKIYNVKESSGITSILYKDGRLYGGGFKKKNGLFYPVIFQDISKETYRESLLSYQGKILDITYYRKKIFYAGYGMKNDKNALLLGNYNMR